MKIGILIKDFNSLANWELRILSEIKKSSSLELALLVQDGRVNINSSRSKVLKLIRSGNFWGQLLFKLQSIIESRIFKSITTENKEDIIDYLKSIPTIKLEPKRKGFLDIFSVQDANTVKEYELDIILRHEFGIIRGDILTSSKYGIWSFHSADNSINRGGPAGFWEIILKNSVVGVTLQQLTPELDGGLVIDKGFYNRHWSFIKTRNFVLEQSVSILFKNIRKLEKNQFNPVKSSVYYNPLYKVPKLGTLLKYMINFYITLSSKFVKKILTKTVGVRYQCWTLFVGSGSILDAALFRLNPIRLPKDEFWADPFLFEHNEEVYVFFENFSYRKNHGKISCGIVKNNEITNVKDVFDFSYHLSYPFIFKEDNNIFLMPETSKRRRLEIYKCVEFPDKWELYSTAFEGEEMVDTTYFKDNMGQRWLFTNKGYNDFNSELHIYRIDSLELKKIEPHKNNPVIIDSRISRNGGSIFKYQDKIIRPSQNNSNGVYGYGLNLNQIEKLTIDEYVEKKIIGLHPNFKKGLMSMHHLHQLNNRFVIDAAYKSK